MPLQYLQQMQLCKLYLYRSTKLNKHRVILDLLELHNPNKCCFNRSKQLLRFQQGLLPSMPGLPHQSWWRT